MVQWAPCRMASRSEYLRWQPPWACTAACSRRLLRRER
jgi:hypothetical protein